MRRAAEQRVQVHPRLKGKDVDRLIDAAYKRGKTAGTLAAEVLEQWLDKHCPAAVEEVTK